MVEDKLGFSFGFFSASRWLSLGRFFILEGGFFLLLYDSGFASGLRAVSNLFVHKTKQYKEILPCAIQEKIDCSSGYELFFSKINAKWLHICTSRLDVITRYVIKKPTHHLTRLIACMLPSWVTHHVISDWRFVTGQKLAKYDESERPAVFQWCSFWEGTLKHCCSFVVCICGLHCWMPELCGLWGENVGLDLCLVSYAAYAPSDPLHESFLDISHFIIIL